MAKQKVEVEGKQSEDRTLLESGFLPWASENAEFNRDEAELYLVAVGTKMKDGCGFDFDLL